MHNDPGDSRFIKRGHLVELLYADDTLVLSVFSSSLERYLGAGSEPSASFGWELHSNKYQPMQIKIDELVRRTSGEAITPAHEMLCRFSVFPFIRLIRLST